MHTYIYIHMHTYTDTYTLHIDITTDIHIHIYIYHTPTPRIYTHIYKHVCTHTHTHVHAHICACRSCYLTPWAGLWGKVFLFHCWHQQGAPCFPVLCCWAHSIPASQQFFPIVGFIWQQFIQTVWNAVSFQNQVTEEHWSDEALKQIYWNF